MTFRRQHRGFTLLELLIAIALMVFLMAIVVQIFIVSTNVFNRAKAKTEIYQNARFALDRLGKEFNNALSTELLTQDWRMGFPVAGGTATGTTPVWAGDKTTFATDPDGSTALVSGPFAMFVTSTGWIDTDGKQQVGTARVVYRIKRYVIPDAVETVSCTLERVLLTPEAYSSSDDPFTSSGAPASAYSANRLKDSKSVDVPNVDYCQFVYWNDGTSTAHFAIQYFDRVSKTYVSASAGSLTRMGSATDAISELPPSVRVVMDVIDEKDREIRTLSRQLTVFAAR